MMKQAKLFLAALTISAFSLGVSQVNAQDIQGSIVFQGSASVDRASDMSMTPTTVSFANNWVFVGGTGDYSAILIFNPATFTNFSFTGDGAGAALVSAIAPLWTTSYNGITYSFDLLALSNGHTESGSMSFTGSGLLHETGKMDTPGTFALSGSGQNFQFIFDNEQNTAVPEISTTALFVLGFMVLIGATTLRRRRLFA